MGFFTKQPKTRRELLDAADQARSRGKLKKAVAGYREALAQDPGDANTNLKLGAVLARLRDADGATACFRLASQRHLEAGFLDRASAVNAAAVEALPLSADFRLETARLNVLRGRHADAVRVLLSGAQAQLKASQPAQAVSLLERGLEIEPWHPDSVLTLAPLLARQGKKDEARALAAGLETRVHGPARRRARWLVFRLSPGLRTFFRWLFAGKG